MNEMKKILIVEDDLALSAGVCFDLEADNYMTVAAYTYEKAIKILEKYKFDLILLDVNLPDGNGFDLCKHIKSNSDTPVVFLSANDLEEDALGGFEAGAEDYITKPFSIHILRKKIQVILKRSNLVENRNIFEDGNLTIDFETLTATRAGETIAITPNEYKILKLLISNAGNVLTRQVLLDRLWDQDGNFIDEHTLTVNITRLRNKIEDKEHKYIKTIYGMGYVWKGIKVEGK